MKLDVLRNEKKCVVAIDCDQLISFWVLSALPVFKQLKRFLLQFSDVSSYISPSSKIESLCFVDINIDNKTQHLKKAKYKPKRRKVEAKIV